MLDVLANGRLKLGVANGYLAAICVLLGYWASTEVIGLKRAYR